MDAALFCEKIPVAPAAEHDFRIQAAAELRAGFREKARKIRDAFDLIAERWDVFRREQWPAGIFPILHRQEKIPAHGGDEQRGGRSGNAFIGKILDEIEKFARAAADFRKETEVLGRVIRFEILVAGAVKLCAAGEQTEKNFIPNHG